MARRYGRRQRRAARDKISELEMQVDFLTRGLVTAELQASQIRQDAYNQAFREFTKADQKIQESVAHVLDQLSHRLEGDVHGVASKILSRMTLESVRIRPGLNTPSGRFERIDGVIGPIGYSVAIFFEGITGDENA